jgi:hypothetical protein
LDDVGRQIRWLAGLFAGVDLLITGLVVLLGIPAADPMAAWLMGSAAAGAVFAVLTAVGAGLQYCGRLLAAGHQDRGQGRSAAKF